MPFRAFFLSRVVACSLISRHYRLHRPRRRAAPATRNARAPQKGPRPRLRLLMLPSWFLSFKILAEATEHQWNSAQLRAFIPLHSRS